MLCSWVFLFCRDLAGSSVYAGCADLSVKELYEHCIEMFMYECHVLWYSSKCSDRLHVFKPGVIALPFIICEVGAKPLLVFCIWRMVSCLMGSHVGPRAGCGCCMPCEVVACIVVLPLPVVQLMGISCLLLVGIYFHDLPPFCGFCLNLWISGICSGLSPFYQYMNLHVTVMQ